MGGKYCYILIERTLTDPRGGVYRLHKGELRSLLHIFQCINRMQQEPIVVLQTDQILSCNPMSMQGVRVLIFEIFFLIVHVTLATEPNRMTLPVLKKQP